MRSLILEHTIKSVSLIYCRLYEHRKKSRKLGNTTNNNNNNEKNCFADTRKCIQHGKIQMNQWYSEDDKCNTVNIPPKQSHIFVIVFLLRSECLWSCSDTWVFSFSIFVLNIGPINSKLLSNMVLFLNKTEPCHLKYATYIHFAAEMFGEIVYHNLCASFCNLRKVCLQATQFEEWCTLTFRRHHWKYHECNKSFIFCITLRKTTECIRTPWQKQSI